MRKLKKTVFINEPVEVVFALVIDTQALAKLWPSLLRVDNLVTLENGGSGFDYIYMMAGMRFKGKSEDIVFIRNEKVTSKTKLGITSEITWDFIPEDGGTRLDFCAEYNIPFPLLGNFAEKLIAGMNDLDISVLMKNLKKHFENPES